MAALKRLPVYHHSAGYILFPLGPSYLWKSNTALAGARGSVCSLAIYRVAYEETQSKQVSAFRDFVCSLFPKAILSVISFLTLISNKNNIKQTKIFKQ